MVFLASLTVVRHAVPHHMHVHALDPLPEQFTLPLIVAPGPCVYLFGSGISVRVASFVIQYLHFRHAS